MARVSYKTLSFLALQPIQVHKWYLKSPCTRISQKIEFKENIHFKLLKLKLHEDDEQTSDSNI